MTRYLRQTELWGIENGRRFIMNEITATSKFKTVDLTAQEQRDQHTPEVQLKIARSLRDGWRFHGPYPNRKYEIVQKWSDGDVVVN